MKDKRYLKIITYFQSITILLVSIACIVALVWSFKNYNIYASFLSIITLNICIYLGHFIMPKSIMFSKGIYKFNDSEILSIINANLRESKVKYNNLYIYINKLDYYNARIFKNKDIYIFISEDLLEKLSKKDVMAILYHEIYHVINKDLIKGSFLVSTYLFLLSFFLYIINILESNLYYILFVIISIVCVVFIFTFYKRQEINADIYGAKKMGDYNVYINMLEKIHPYSRKVISTHPSLEKRKEKIIKYFKENEIK
ncbi:M48 family metallopeptidase [Anaerobranca gottschalkii]|uniref:Zn-dependent protease with chaperone function n=1 Tax=Anaerobranca gottschalkii DSM 13577 TaxID=1120990 RepID=A0A1I0B9F6_9FIRM|nr:M48 family metalloprotease [Anaerobranca gottschalkii]SET03174.1 Zn-dependent protease with chaperone function [Anaerobranca gottschalkii DSM 13577]